MLILTENGIIAARDALGRTPIVIGKKDGETVILMAKNLMPFNNIL